MSTATPARFQELLSRRAAIGPTGPGTLDPITPAVKIPVYDFYGGRPDPASFPYAALVEATARVLQVDGASAMTYGEAQGYIGLRDLICHKYELFEGLKVGSDNIIVANGAADALALAISAYVDFGDAVICEAPTYPGTLSALRRHGAEMLDVPVDAEGIATSAVRARLETLREQGRRCKLVYTQVNFQNPVGPSMSLRRRKELVALAQEYQTLILEDDAYGELRFDGEALPSLYALDDSQSVIRAGTFSKTLGPGVRLGWLCAPKDMIPAFQGFNFGGGVNPFVSRVAALVLGNNLARHVEQLIELYRPKRDAMLRGLTEVLASTDVEISKPEGGFFLWIRLPTGTDRQKLFQLAGDARVQFIGGQLFYPNGGGEEFIRLSYSMASAEKCYAGSRLLGEAILGSLGGSPRARKSPADLRTSR